MTDHVRGVSCHRSSRYGLTLIELLLAITVITMIVVALGALQAASTLVYDEATARGQLADEARRCLDRISRAVETATANERFPGAWVVSELSDGEQLPETQSELTDDEQLPETQSELTDGEQLPQTLVVWNPDGEPVDPDGKPRKPRLNELVFFLPDEISPAIFCEIRVPDLTDEVPELSDKGGWRTLVDRVATHDSAERIVLARNLRVVSFGGKLRGMVRFVDRIRPTEDDWDTWEESHKDDKTWGTWAEIPWVQGVFGPDHGLRQTWIRSEFQFIQPTEHQPIELTIFGSATRYYTLPREQQ